MQLVMQVTAAVINTATALPALGTTRNTSQGLIIIMKNTTFAR